MTMIPSLSLAVVLLMIPAAIYCGLRAWTDAARLRVQWLLFGAAALFVIAQQITRGWLSAAFALLVFACFLTLLVRQKTARDQTNR